MNEKGGDGVIRIVVSGSRKASVPGEAENKNKPGDKDSEQEGLASTFLSITKNLDEIARRGFIVFNGEKVIKLPVQPSDFEGSLKLYEEKLEEFIRRFDEKVLPRQAALEKKGFKVLFHRKLDIEALRLSDYENLFGKIANDFDVLLTTAHDFQNETLGEDAYIESVENLSKEIDQKIDFIENKFGYRLPNNREWYEELERRNNIKGLTQSSLYSDLKIFGQFAQHLNDGLE